MISIPNLHAEYVCAYSLVFPRDSSDTNAYAVFLDSVNITILKQLVDCMCCILLDHAISVQLDLVLGHGCILKKMNENYF